MYFMTQATNADTPHIDEKNTIVVYSIRYCTPLACLRLLEPTRYGTIYVLGTRPSMKQNGTIYP